MKRKALGIMLFLAILTGFFGCNQRTTETPAIQTIEVTIIDEDTARFVSYGPDEHIITSVDDDYSQTVTNVLELLQSHFTVYCQGSDGNPDDTCSFSGMYGFYVMGIGELTAFGTREYIGFYIDGAYAMSGIGDTDIEVGKTYRFLIETF